MNTKDESIEQSSSFLNPFENKEGLRVWKQLLANSEPVSNEETLRKIKKEIKRRKP